MICKNGIRGMVVVRCLYDGVGGVHEVFEAEIKADCILKTS